LSDAGYSGTYDLTTRTLNWDGVDYVASSVDTAIGS